METGVSLLYKYLFNMITMDFGHFDDIQRSLTFYLRRIIFT